MKRKGFQQQKLFCQFSTKKEFMVGARLLYQKNHLLTYSDPYTVCSRSLTHFLVTIQNGPRLLGHTVCYIRDLIFHLSRVRIYSSYEYGSTILHVSSLQLISSLYCIPYFWGNLSLDSVVEHGFLHFYYTGPCRGGGGHFLHYYW